MNTAEARTFATIFNALGPSSVYEVSRYINYPPGRMPSCAILAAVCTESDTPVLELAETTFKQEDGAESTRVTHVSVHFEVMGELLVERAVTEPPEDAEPFRELSGEQRRQALSDILFGISGVLASRSDE